MANSRGQNGSRIDFCDLDDPDYHLSYSFLQFDPGAIDIGSQCATFGSMERPIPEWFVCLKDDGTEGKSRHIIPAGSVRALCGTKLEHFRAATESDWKCWTCQKARQDRPDFVARAIDDVVEAGPRHETARKARFSAGHEDDQKKYGYRIVVENMDVFVVGPTGKVPLDKCIICESRFIAVNDNTHHVCTGLCRRKWCRISALAYHRGKTFEQVMAQPDLWDF